MAQRLIRVLCDKCKQPDHEPDRDVAASSAGISRRGPARTSTLYKPRGCDYCTGTGFRGRMGIFEMMHMNNEIRELAFKRAPTNKIRKAALASGMKSLLRRRQAQDPQRHRPRAEEIVKVAQVEGIVTAMSGSELTELGS